jgi:hypothetical protein
VETLGYLCLGYLVIGVALLVAGYILTPLIEYDGDNGILFRLGDFAEDAMGQLTAGYLLALPIIMVICCYLTGRALGEIA